MKQIGIITDTYQHVLVSRENYLVKKMAHPNEQGESKILQWKSRSMNISFFTEKVLLIVIKTEFFYFWYLYSIFWYISFIFITEFEELQE